MLAWTYFGESERDVFKKAVALNETTRQRARGWALWTALITASAQDPNQRMVGDAWKTIDVLVQEYQELKI